MTTPTRQVANESGVHLRRTLAPLLVACFAAPVYAGGLAIVGTELRDNGDHDGFADTLETAEVWLTVKNTTTGPLTGIIATLSNSSATDICIVDGAASIGDLAPGQQARASEPLIFYVGASRDRTALGLGPLSDLSVSFDVAFTASPTSPAAFPSELAFDLDIDVTASGAPTTMVEDFESGGFGLFSVDNQDFGLHYTGSGDDPNYPRRCQYHVEICATWCPLWCTLGASAAAANAIWWQVDGPAVPGGGRGYSGTHSLYFGAPLGPTLGYTTPTAAMEAVALAAPVRLASGKWCSNAPATSCVDAAGCPAGGACAEVSPALSFKHQVSFLDNRIVPNVPASDPAKALDRGVVAIQLANASGAAVGPWMRLEPSVNVYDSIPSAYFRNCTFDPIDDGSDQNDLYPGYMHGVGSSRGPSSTCADERVFTYMGSTEGAFSPSGLGYADGPGLSGFHGPGTWVETRFDLSRFKGRYVRIRFLASTTSSLGSQSVTWEDGFVTNPHPGDDGWWIDNVTLSGVSAAAGGVANDTHDNSGLTLDADLDGADDRCKDNCVGLSNPSQVDFDVDFVGDACDSCTDGDADGFGNSGYPLNTCALDNCPSVANPTQGDADLDGTGEACDNCPGLSNADQANVDGDGPGDLCDCAPGDGYTYAGAPEVNDGIDNQCPGEEGYGTVDEISGMIEFLQEEYVSWPPQQFANLYKVAMLTGTSFSSVTTCATRSDFDYSPVSTPPPGKVTYVLVRAQSPHVGSWGRNSAGVSRTVSCASPP